MVRKKRKPDEIVFQALEIGKIYKMGEVEVQALQSVSLELRAGEFTVLLGPSGSGKSTLLNILGGLDTPSYGSVRFRNRNLFSANEEELTSFRRDHVGFVFQFYNLIPSLTAVENVSLVTELGKNSMSPEEALRLVGLLDRKDHFPAQLSGGEQQRVAIARAIAKRPDVLLCDEPTGALDFKTGRIVLDAIEKIHSDLGTTTVIITHNAAIAEIADRVVQMRDGTIVSDRRNSKKKKSSELNW
ncbi:ABC transporter ATP-binding protein [Leptospira ellisii]|uniref:ABC transporter n=1 Tax=Leptospira ellisii TaxID=2023197 RepID=A0A2N0BFG5_9LEPT|nr:ABC transporter ATP-binding protein [Leptospira ellisii]MDV6237774.1 ABC transporter ATP-binding protein [Leptospira ellisii]PJZ93963.1 ABC transporter [Leptospira ellisii]PKA02726.1 ABC transporter [Leptospira ellisii]